MTLRDIGTWLAERWDAILAGFRIASTQSLSDWPLWLSFPVAIGVPVLVLWWIGALIREARTGEPDSLCWTIGFGVATFLCALVTYDVWVSMTVWNEGDERMGWLRIGYPIMTTFFGSYFFVAVAKHRRSPREKSDKQ